MNQEQTNQTATSVPETPKTIRSSRNFELRQTGNRFFVRCLADDCKPRALRVSKKDAEYLKEQTTDGHFENVCVIDIGAGIFQS